MFFFRRQRKKAKKPLLSIQRIRPRLEGLEDRTLPDASGPPAAAVDFLRTPAGRIFLGQSINQAQSGPISGQTLAQDVANAEVLVNVLTLLNLPALPLGPPMPGSVSLGDFFRTPAGL